MNIFTDGLFLFLFIFTLLYFRMPDVLNNKYMVHKFFIFIGVFCFYYVIQMIKKIKSKCTIEPYNLLYKSINMALWCTLGYSIYVDLLYMDESKKYFLDINSSNLDKTKRFVIIALIIVSIVVLIELFGMMFKTNIDECELNTYLI